MITFISQSFAILILAVGVWSWSEKDRFSNLGKLAHIILDPAFIFVIVGKFANLGYQCIKYAYFMNKHSLL